MDSIIKSLEALSNFLQAHPLAFALVLALILSIAATEIVKSIWRNLYPELVSNRVKRRNAYLYITAIVHWIIVWRIYSLAKGPFLYDVAIFSPIASAVVVWFLHRLVEAMALVRGPQSIWSVILAKLKPHRVVSEEVEVDPNETTQYHIGDHKKLLLNKRRNSND